jgi:hypothetical protein
MKRQHAVEIILTRQVTRAELHRAHRTVQLAANADRTRLMTVRRTKSPGRALRSLRHELDHPLPINVLTSHYPGPFGPGRAQRRVHPGHTFPDRPDCEGSGAEVR